MKWADNKPMNPTPPTAVPSLAALARCGLSASRSAEGNGMGGDHRMLMLEGSE